LPHLGEDGIPKESKTDRFFHVCISEGLALKTAQYIPAPLDRQAEGNTSNNLTLPEETGLRGLKIFKGWER